MRSSLNKLEAPRAYVRDPIALAQPSRLSQKANARRNASLIRTRSQSGAIQTCIFSPNAGDCVLLRYVPKLP